MFKNEKTRAAASIALKILLLAVGVAGLVITLSAGSFMRSIRGFLFFTIQSNVTILAMVALFLVGEVVRLLSGKAIIGRRMLLAKFVFTVAIAVTFLIFFLVLAPTQTRAYLLAFENLGVHFFVPLLAIADFLLFDTAVDVSGLKPLWGIAMPLYYVIFALACSAAGVNFNGNPVPYFFLDYTRLGWFTLRGGLGVFYWIVLLGALITGLSFLLAFAAKRVRAAAERKRRGNAGASV